MTRKSKIIAALALPTLLLLVAVGLMPSAARAQDNDRSMFPGNLRSGAVYVMTNQVQNAIAVFDRAPDGSLNSLGEFPTGGSGNPVAMPPGPPTDPLASQGALQLSDDGRFLFAVNAGSGEISVMAIRRGGLVLVHKVHSGGTRPISLTLHSGLLYVLNEGGTPNITGFMVGNRGHLTPIPDSTRPLSGNAMTDPAQVGFSPDGELLVVTEKASNSIDVYTVEADGVAKGPTVQKSNGQTPFGFVFDGRATLLVTEAFGGMPNQAAVSSYEALPEPGLEVTSGSVHNKQTATCWIVTSKNGRFAYTSNTGNGTISTYRVRRDGVLRLVHAAAADLGAGTSPIDIALDQTGRYLYVHAAGAQAILAFRVENDGSLQAVSNIGGLPFGAQGIAAR